VTEFARTRLGFYQQRPMPSREELSEFYRSQYYQRESVQYSSSYSEDELRWFDLGAAVADHVCRAERPGAGLRLLDVGCGEGFFMRGMADRGWSVRGYDFSAFGISRCNPDLLDRFEQGEVSALIDRDAAAGATYDAINLTNVLEHVSDPEGLLARLRPLCAPDGLLVIDVPHDFSDLQRALLASGKVDREYWIAPTEHLNYFTPASLSAVLAANGWRVERTLSDFPIEHFLLHDGSNYVADAKQGKQAHLARVFLDLHFSRDLGAYVRLLEAQAACGMGRSILAFASPSPGAAPPGED
jgi:2-polyprenyl-3-methyl-5-hydroxy-6-metoxy-1,4-benzoquinol methylase